MPTTRAGLIAQLAAALAGGNEVVVGNPALRCDLPATIAQRVRFAADWRAVGPYAGALIEGDALPALAALADLPGPIVLPQTAPYRLEWLVEEVSTSINTTAAGGNASLMAMV
jgi:RHH-type proline utilization regulon transcriptional repressor/proline dehydrogenase/delta 1-pyrroline-5-carboxylate dehydrogenase